MKYPERVRVYDESMTWASGGEGLKGHYFMAGNTDSIFSCAFVRLSPFPQSLMNTRAHNSTARQLSSLFIALMTALA